jgi:hypothetical protein
MKKSSEPPSQTFRSKPRRSGPRVIRTAGAFSAAAVVWAVLAAGAAAPRGQESAEAVRRQAFDTILDLNVRDGFVYYRALKSDRSRLDGYVTSLATASIESAPREEQIAFWLNAYNALVLRTVIDQYPIPLRSAQYPPHSIRQIPGAFERTPRHVGGKTMTLDQIEQTVLPGFNDPRLFLALGRGAMGSGRLRSEAFTAADLERQLSEVAAECLTRAQCMQVDRAANTVKVSSIFSWRERDFTGAYSEGGDPKFGTRSPMERAVLAFVKPRLLTTELEFLERNEFQVKYIPFDWTLNDLGAR